MYGLILVYLLTAIGIIGAFKRPMIGLYVYVGLAVLRPQSIWGFAGNFSSLSFYVGVAVLVSWAMKGFGSWEFGRARPVVLAYLAFVTWFLLSATQALNTEGSYRAVQELVKLALPFLVGVTMMNTEKDWRMMLWTIVLAQGYVAYEANNNYIFKGVNTAAEGFGGSDNNFFGLSLVCVLGPAVALMMSTTTWQARAAASVVAVLILHAILLTFSRGAMVGLLAVGLVAFVMMPKRPKHLAVLLLVGILAARFTGPELLARYATTFVSGDERDASAESRVDLWADCMRVVGDYPILGVGPWNWSTVAAMYGWPPGKSAHSVWMESAAELGLPGVLALIAFFATAGLRLWPIARARPTKENWYEVALASGVVLSIVGFFVSGQFVSAQGLEIPYYVTMTGAALLKTTSRRTADATTTGHVFTPQAPPRPAFGPLPMRRSTTGRF